MFNRKVITLNGAEVQLMPWKAQAPCPWKEGYSRVVRSRVFPTKSGKMAEVLVVKNSKLKTIHAKFVPQKAAR